MQWTTKITSVNNRNWTIEIKELNIIKFNEAELFKTEL